MENNFDNKLEVKNLIICILDKCDDPTDLKSYISILGRNYNWLTTGIFLDPQWSLPYVKSNPIISFCCGIKYFNKDEIKILISIASKRLFYFDKELLEKSQNNRRKVNYTFEMSRICRMNRFKYELLREEDIFNRNYNYILKVIDSKGEIIFTENYEISESYTLNDNLELILKCEDDRKFTLRNKRKINNLQLLSKLFLLNYLF